jgi:hypothetical protein
MPRTITALCAVVVAAGLIVLSGAVLVLHADVGRLQAQLDARPVQSISCADLAHVQFRVHGHDAHCQDRGTP